LVQPPGIVQQRITAARSASISSRVIVVSRPLSAWPTSSRLRKAGGDGISTGSIPAPALRGGGGGAAGGRAPRRRATASRGGGGGCRLGRRWWRRFGACGRLAFGVRRLLFLGGLVAPHEFDRNRVGGDRHPLRQQRHHHQPCDGKMREPGDDEADGVGAGGLALLRATLGTGFAR